MKTKTILGISLAAVFAVSMIFAGSLSQADAINTNPKNPNAGGKHSPDFRITDAGYETAVTDSLWMTVQGTAGATEPKKPGDIYVYAWFFDTFAIIAASHDFDDTTPDITPGEYHYHRVTTNDDGCVTSITDPINDPTTTLDGDTITIDAIPGLAGAEPAAAATAVFNVDLDRPKGDVCLIHVFSFFEIEDED